MQMLQKYHDNDYFVCVQHEPENADNARKFGIWFDGKLREVYATNEFIIVRKWH